MKHVSKKALLGSVAVTLKGDDEDPASIVTKALGDFSTEFEKKFDDRFKALEGKSAVVDPKLVERLDKIEAKQNRPGAGAGDDKEAKAVELKAWVDYLRRGDKHASAEDLKTLTVADDTAAGYLAPAETSTDIIRDITELSPIRQFATVRNSMAPSVKYPRRTGITNAKWEGEIEESEESEPTFGQTEIVSRRLTTFVDLSNSLLMGSNGMAEAEVRSALAEDFAKKEAMAFVNGDGIKQPEGLMVNAEVPYVANGHATNLSTDALITLMYSLPAFYRNKGVWVLNGTSLATIRKMKDGQGQYLWQPSFQAGQPETILGRPVAEAIDMADIGAATFPILFGDLATGYRIVDRQQFGVLSDPYTQARRAITRLHGTRWVGAGVVQPKAVRKLKMATT
ncbi:phage major capsid protein [Tardiphaga sp. vice352]|uniref:phage major capsid protein n=1 Tax=unclassified Tardiphaga TaxID=2631404 RepID=UPI00116472ED|nr:MULTISPECIES: phage major capsid protein [unclassified Tardiphaga]QDM14583.1 phage major capsid protein [Tardiphaga sp. vice278]QDM29971.1 phage major capsid protein [Tardiphaga sp. vice352]